MSETPVKQPLWQRAIGIVIGTAIGGIIYGIFLEALLIQSLVFDRKPLDPAQWQKGLTGRAWICGILLFLTLVSVPFRFLARADGATVLTDLSEGGVVWLLLSLIFMIQIATVIYARMRPELCTIEHPIEVFNYGRNPCGRRRRLVSEWTSGGQTTRPCLQLSFSLGSWKNMVQFVIICLEFFQLFSLAIDNGSALRNAGVNLLSPSFLDGIATLKNAAWQFGMTSGESFDTNFGLLCGFSGFYIFLCGVFIALDLTVDSPLSPLLFTLLAGGFYGTITSGLLFVIFYSPNAPQVLVSLLMLVYYSSTAVFVSIYRSDAKKVAAGEVRLMPIFTAVERVLKGVLAGVTVATQSSSSTVRASVALCFTVALLALLLAMKPYSVNSITAFRASSIGVCVWTALLVLFASALPGVEASGPPLAAMLIVGWVLIPLILGLLTRFGICCLAVATVAVPVTNPLTEHSQVIEIVEDGLHFKQSKLAAPELTNG